MGRPRAQALGGRSRQTWHCLHRCPHFCVYGPSGQSGLAACQQLEYTPLARHLLRSTHQHGDGGDWEHLPLRCGPGLHDYSPHRQLTPFQENCVALLDRCCPSACSLGGCYGCPFIFCH